MQPTQDMLYTNFGVVVPSLLGDEYEGGSFVFLFLPVDVTPAFLSLENPI